MMKRIRIKLFAALTIAIALFLMPAGALSSELVPNSSAEEFSFLFFGDIQVAESVAQDYAAWEELAKGAMARNPGAAFVLQGGDIVESGIDDAQWDAFLKSADNALGDTPFFPTNGNHESNFLSGKPEKYLKVFNLPQNGPEGFKGEFYSFDYGDAHVLVLNSWVFSGEQRLSENDLDRLDAWVAADLAKSVAKWKIVLTHLPPTPVHSDTTGRTAGEHWNPIFEKYGVTLVLVGHQHVYSRLKPLTGGAPDYADGVTQIMGNSGLKHYGSADESLADRTIYGVSTYQVIRVSEKSLTVQCFDGGGNELDYVSLTPRETGVTRLEYIEALWRAADPPDAAPHPFTDTPESAALSWAYETGLILGCGGGRFAPDSRITGEHIQIILSRM